MANSSRVLKFGYECGILPLGTPDRRSSAHSVPNFLPREDNTDSVSGRSSWWTKIFMGPDEPPEVPPNLLARGLATSIKNRTSFCFNLASNASAALGVQAPIKV